VTSGRIAKPAIACMALLFGLGCKRDVPAHDVSTQDVPSQQPPTERPAPLLAPVLDSGAPPVRPSEGPVLHRAERKMMGTIWTMTLVGGAPEAARAAAERAFDEVARLEALLSEWQPTSEISRVNQNAGVAPVEVGPELLACVQASLDVARWSGGAFDISWAGLRGLWDFGPDSTQVPPSRERIRELLPLWNYRNIVVDEAKRTIFLKRKGMQIGLGGVAKGYALDRAGELLQQAGFENYLMYAGGQVLTHGRKGDRPWRVGIQHPREPRHFAFVEIEDGSLATSGDYEHAYEYEGRYYHHIIDPKTGYPSDKSAGVTLVAPTALWADAIDTAVFILGPEKGLDALRRAPGGPFDAAVVDPQMRLFVNEGMRARLVMSARIEADRRIGAPLGPDEPRKLPAAAAKTR
jgi:FAD:protein FMN transferase